MRFLRTSAALAVALTLAACSDSSTAGPSTSGGPGSGGGSTGFGTLKIMMKDSPFSDAKAVLVTFSEVSVHKSGGGWETLPFDGGFTARTCDLKHLEDVTDLLGVGPLEAGHYTQIRLTVASAVLYFANPAVGAPCASTITAPLGSKADVSVPSGTLHLNREFDLAADAIVTITLDFDGDKSIKETGGGKFMMQPVIAILSVS
jgi:hypothetical protein